MEPPAVTLPKGGGAIRGIGEKFNVSAATGTGTLTVPVVTSPGRAGFGAQLALSYDSGRGNGPLGFGWSLGVPAITRKTDKGLPRYRDAQESDVFLLDGAEDLVPELDPGRDWAPVTFVEPEHARGYRIDRYRPRVEDTFTRIERWTRLADGETHWRTISRDNVTTVYGADPGSRIADPLDTRRVFSWLICHSFDDLGNAIVYEYKPEDRVGVDVRQAHERHRTPETCSANRYLKKIKYGNRVSRLMRPDLTRNDWMFEIVFDYGEHDADVPTSDGDGDWAVRDDPFSSYRAGFEVRTYRLCRRILMFHHFPDAAGVGAKCLVMSTDLTYATGAPAGSFLTSVTHCGYRRTRAGGYLRRSLPPLELGYSSAEIRQEVRELDPASLADLPAGLTAGSQWADLDGDGIPGVLTAQTDRWYYKPGLGGGRLGPALPVTTVPAGGLTGSRALVDLTGDGRLDVVDLSGPAPGYFRRTDERAYGPFTTFTELAGLPWRDPDLRFVDLDGDGISDALITDRDGFIWSAAHVTDTATGYGDIRHAETPGCQRPGPRLLFSDRTQSIHLADMSGDGLKDLLRIRNGEICYWPNLGYGRFGAKVTMDAAPLFDVPEAFDPRLILLADVDGSGLTDIVYLGGPAITIHLNDSGNSWHPPHRLTRFPRVDDQVQISAVDLLGTGTACLVWSSPFPRATGRAVRYVDLMGGAKPHLLTTVRNNLGARTDIDYVSSTRFYLDDQAAGRPWATRLPFPVQVVERVTVHDQISRNRFVTRYAYHHGYFDGPEREFRGFGMVEQFDSEELAVLGAEGDVSGAEHLEPTSDVPPVLTRSWFHTGAYLAGRGISRHFEREYYREPGLSDDQAAAFLLPDTVLPDTVLLADGSRRPYQLTADEPREACRALKGRLLRREVYGLDGSPVAAQPYTVSERTYSIDLLQPGRRGRDAVFLSRPRETIEFHHDRATYQVGDAERADPRVSHEVTLAINGYGDSVRTATVAYGRRFKQTFSGPPLPVELTGELDGLQRRTSVLLAESDYTNPVAEPLDHRVPQPAAARTYELLGLNQATVPGGLGRPFTFGELARAAAAAGDGAHDLPYEDVHGTGAVEDRPHRRLVEHVRTLYRRDDLTGPLPVGGMEPRGLPFTTYKLAFTRGLLARVYPPDVLPDPAAVLADECGYISGDAMIAAGRFPASDPAGQWWLPTGEVFYSPDGGHSPAQERDHAVAHFFRPCRYRDPFAATTTVAYDNDDLLLLQTRDALGNLTTAGLRDSTGEAVTRNGNDYRVLQPALVMDPNGNRSAVVFDALGLVTGTALLGKPGQNAGDDLDGFEPDLAEEQILGYLADPLGENPSVHDPHTLLGNATTRLIYDVAAFWRTRHERHPAAPVAASLTRVTHAAEPGGSATPIQRAFAYSDGFGREIQQKVQAEPGPLAEGGPVAERRWTGTGWTVFNNKGKPVRQYEPFFSATHNFEFAHKSGVSSVLFYDPADRIVVTLHPDHTYGKELFDPWCQESWDGNDTVLLHPGTDPHAAAHTAAYLETFPHWDTWHDRRAGGALGPHALAAAAKTAVHAATPVRGYADALGRSVLVVHHNRYERAGTVVDRAEPILERLDIEGNRRATVDALGRLVEVREFDLLSNAVRVAAMDGGDVTTLLDVAGNPVRTWDARGHATRHTYDRLRRPLRVYVSTRGGPFKLVERTVYGEAHPAAAAGNLRTRVCRHFDGAGLVTVAEHDFKGNLARSGRRLATAHRQPPDWTDLDRLSDSELATATSGLPLSDEELVTRTNYDALDRPVIVIQPDGSVIRPAYNQAGLVDSLEVNIRGAIEQGRPVWTPVITGADYDAKGRRTRVTSGNATTTHVYDPETARLTQRRTTRAAIPGDVQRLAYTYDPAGNITHVRDDAQQTVFFANQRAEPHAEYTYDARYQLVKASAREHAGQGGPPGGPPTRTDEHRLRLPHPNDGNAIRPYTQVYAYDAAGNLEEMVHLATGGGWTRRYAYAEASALEPARGGNRLSSTVVGTGPAESCAYDENGNLRTVPGLTELVWDHRDRLVAATREGGSRVYFSYDGDGQRVRKVVEAPDGTVQRERVYTDLVEIYHEYDARGRAVTLERETLHLMDDQRRVALVETRVAGSDPAPAQLIRFQHDNHLGSACLELDEAGQVISYEEYHPYGSTAFQTVRAQHETPKRYRYTGRERDEETGLAYHGARYYAPWLGRWISTDPSGLADGPNLYVYAHDNPVRIVDPGGHTGEEWEQLNLARQFTQEVRATRTGRGFGEELRKDIQAMWDWWGGSGKAHVGHPPDKPQAFLKAGESVTVRAEPALQNVKEGASVIKRMAQAVRKALFERILSGSFVRTAKGVDPTAPKGLVVQQPPPAPWRLSEAFEKFKGQRGFTAASQGITKSAVSPVVAETVSEAAAVSKAATLTKAAEATGRFATVAKAVRPLGPVLGTASKVAGPAELGMVGLQLAGARNTGEKVEAGIGMVGAAVGMIPSPYARAASAGIAVGQGIEKTLDVSTYSAGFGTKAYEGLKRAGVNDNVAFVAGGAVTALSTPAAFQLAAMDQIAKVSRPLLKWLGR
ncbi:SpvB/TcaC N-terminal domain-containing protein [Nonomuraea sp. B19D2]|uniref:SpvB/TcaC N-terminal domain-containing protein n=1 Tax=Nonomuraea sp. B19D2 TaxID=3159561 RepID=UPI0032DBF1CA